MVRFLSKNIQSVKLSQISNDNLTLFTRNYDSSALILSINAIGITNPLILKPHSNEKFQIVCGHRRAQTARQLGLDNIPAWLISANLPETEVIRLNLIENSRTYGDIERGNIIAKLIKCKTPINSIIKDYMPIIGLEKSKNLFDQYANSANLEEDLQKIFHELNISIQVYRTCFSWGSNSQKIIRNSS